MNLSKDELIKLHPSLKRFENQSWFSEESIKPDCNYNKLPMIITFEIINEMINYIQKNKFNTNWEACFGITIKLEQLRDLLKFYCNPTLEERTRKGDF